MLAFSKSGIAGVNRAFRSTSLAPHEPFLYCSSFDVVPHGKLTPKVIFVKAVSLTLLLLAPLLWLGRLTFSLFP